jgi:hypothetical protein
VHVVVSFIGAGNRITTTTTATPVCNSADRATQTSLKTGMNSGAPKVLSVPAIHMTSAALLLITNRGRRGRGRNPVSCTNKTNHHVHNITKILLKVAFSTKTLTLITNPVILVSHE